MTTFEFRANTEPLVHAFIVGTGAYQQAQKVAADKKLAQLPGVARSAISFADFLVDNSDLLYLPLGSVELLVSDPVGPMKWRDQPVDLPTTEKIEASLSSWLDRCESHKGSLAVFYAGGHGYYRGDLHYLPENAGFGLDPFANAIRLDSFKTGMMTRPIDHQFFIFDCCQNLPHEVSKSLVATSGRSLIPADSTKILKTGQTTIKAAVPGLNAYSDDDGTRLMKALSAALENDAVGQIADGWGARIANLLEAMNRFGDTKYHGEWQTCGIESNDHKLNYFVRRIHAPEVAVRLRINPEIAYPEASISLKDVQSGEIPDCLKALKPCKWSPHNARYRDVRVRSGFYTMAATFSGDANYKDRSEIINPLPPFQECTLFVERLEGEGD